MMNQQHDRREFCRNLVGMAAAAVPAAVSGGHRSVPVNADAASMTLGYSTYGAKAMATVDVIAMCAEIGFDSMELTVTPGWDTDTAELSPTDMREIGQRMRDAGLQLTSLMEKLHIDERDRGRAERTERLRKAAEAAHLMSPDDPPLLQTTIGGRGEWDQVRSIWADELREWIRVADAEALTIAVKPHRGGALSRPDEAAELIRLLNCPARLKLCYDYSHYALRDMTIRGTVEDASSFLGHVAVKDVIPIEQGRTRFVLPGESGMISYPELLTALSASGYTGDICCEISGQVWSAPGYDIRSAADVCYRNMAEAFASAEIQRPAE